jgi:hypothetical protein
MVTTSLREVEAELAAAVSVTLASPLPLDGDALIQLAVVDVLHAQPAGAVTATEALPPPPTMLTDVGDTPYRQLTPGCVTVTACPAIITVVSRGVEAELATAVMVTGPATLDEAGEMVSHHAPDEAVHEQPVGDVTPTVAEPPAVGTDTLVGESVYEHPTPGCVTVTLLSPTVTRPLRGLAEEFAAAFTLSEPLPLPAVGEAVSQAAFDPAVHAHAAWAVTGSVAVPPSGAIASVVAGTL